MDQGGVGDERKRKAGAVLLADEDGEGADREGDGELGAGSGDDGAVFDGGLKAGNRQRGLVLWEDAWAEYELS
jgi:hypothetical protein